jgi:large subunit ribosomal protein L15e
MKSFYNYLEKTMHEKRDSPEWRNMLVAWRRSHAVVRTAKPFRLDRARQVGYKAKNGFIVARVRVIRGGHKKTRPKAARRSRRMTIRKNLKMNYLWIAEQRAQRRFPNMEILNSYNIAQDGRYYFSEVILVDPSRPEIAKDKNINWMTSNKHTGRVFRGLTSAGRKSRGLRHKGNRAIKVRPSLGAWGHKGK